MSQNEGSLWLVATPIGNLEDLSARAIAVLKASRVIACEDTRTSQTLLARHGIGTALTALHEHNEAAISDRLIARVVAGEDVAVISDAGTPLISDPGFRVVAAAIAAGVRVDAVPGPCAAIMALTLSGLPTDRFVFEGFLPTKSAARREALRALATDPRTLIFYEAKHRILESLADLAASFGARRMALARELTKRHQTVLRGTIDEVLESVRADPEQQLGEFVLVVEGAAANADAQQQLIEGERVYHLLRAELAPGRAAALAAQITGAPRRALYRLSARDEAASDAEADADSDDERD